MIFSFHISSQESSPSDKALSAVATYLLTGLFFVTMGIMEYAYLLWMRRRTEIRGKKQAKTDMKVDRYAMNKVSNASKTLEQIAETHSSSFEANYINELVSYCNKVDSFAGVISITFFILFNAVYWASHHQ